jgi:hypothetical protein
MAVRGYRLGVDWSRQGTYAGTLEDVSSYVLDEPVLTVSYGRELSQADAEAASGRLAFALRNGDRTFSPENASSPIADKVLLGTPVQLQATNPATGAIRILSEGAIDVLDIDASAPAKDFNVEVLDAWGRPGAERLSTPVYSGLRTGAAIELVLDAIGWRGGRDIDPGATLIPWWWEEGTDAATAVSRLVRSEGPPAIAYVEGGVFTFRDRHHRLRRPESTTSQGLFTHLVPAGSVVDDFKVLKDSFGYNHGLANIANAVAFDVEQRVPGDLTEVWSTETPITLAAGEVRRIEVRATDPFINAVVPEGVDAQVAYGSVTAALSRTSGQSTIVTLTAGGVAAMVTRLALRAVPVAAQPAVTVSEEDAASIGRYGRRTWPGTVPWASVHDAWAIAQRIVAAYATARPVVSFRIANISGAYLTQILSRRISDRVTVRNDELGVDRDFIVERIGHRIVKLGVRHELELVCEVTDPVQPANVLTFDKVGAGFDDGAFGSGGIDNADQMFVFDKVGSGFDEGVFAS